ncbi:MAG: ImmA/IrrE family metallo-endopeptidase [Flavobacteriaceae bacterium]
MNYIESKALELISNLNANTAPIPIKKIVKQLGVELKPFNLGSEVSGVCVIENNNARIGYNPTESEGRQRFTIAHELGHFILGHNKNANDLFVDNVKVMFRRNGSTTKELKQEREANIFAASILMPENLIQKEYETLEKKDNFLTDDKIVQELASLFKVSQIAMTYRLINLGYMHNNF